MFLIEKFKKNYAFLSRGATTCIFIGKKESDSHLHLIKMTHGYIGLYFSLVLVQPRKTEI